MLALLEELLNSGPMWLFAPLGALLILPVLIEAKPLIDAAKLRRAGIVAGVLAALGWAAAAAAPAYSADRQQRFVIEHVTDARTGNPTGRCSTAKPGCPRPTKPPANGVGTSSTMPTANAGSRTRRRPASLHQRSNASGRFGNASERTITLRLRPNGAERIVLIAPDDARIRAAGTPGFVRAIDAAAEDGKYLLGCFGRSCEKMTLEIVTGQAKPIEFTLVGVRRGLPHSAAPLVTVRRNSPARNMPLTRRSSSPERRSDDLRPL